MGLSPEKNKAIGDAWGALAGQVVDACKSHHASHVDGVDVGPIVMARRNPNAELTEVTLTKDQRCDDSWTTNSEEVIIDYPGSPNVVTLAAPQVRRVDAGEPMQAGVLDTYAQPNQVPTTGVRVKVTLAPKPPGRGLFSGRLRDALGSGADIPVLIYVTDII